MLLALTLITCSGCGGCRRQEPDDEAKQETKSEEKKEADEVDPFEFQELVVQPSHPRKDAITLQYVKPGHWVTANKPIRSNESDFQGILESDCVKSVGSIPIPTENTDSHLIGMRSVPLAKGQWRDNEVNFYIPRQSGEDSGVRLRHRLRSKSGRRVLLDEEQPVITLKAYQYLLLVLTDNPNDYGFLQTSNAVAQEGNPLYSEDDLTYYQVAVPQIDNRVPVPSQALAWTSIAYVFWDRPDYTRLNPDQEKALIDWIHFGGQLIISGPGSVDALRGSFLEPYLPVTSSGARELQASDLEELNANWSIAAKGNAAESRRLELPEGIPMVGAKMALTEGSQFMEGTGELVAERQVGRGRIAVTAFSIDDRALLRWKSFDGFLNGCILRRPARKFGENSFGEIGFSLANYQGSTTDPKFSTTLRYLSRDLGNLSDTANQGRMAVGSGRSAEGKSDRADANDALNGDAERYGWFFGGYSDSAESGVAGWNDQSGISRGARQILRDSAGITPPTSKFVRNVLLIYLALLVPINWTLFRLMRRVEWAWIAVPVIAIGGALIVVRMAALDIGFVRSRTEVSLLEIHHGYSRGHLTRYTALYSSLSTGYEFQFDDLSSQSQPFATGGNVRMASGQALRDVRFVRDRGVRLTDLQVDSASVRMVHSEQMLDLGGSFRLIDSNGQVAIENGTEIPLRDAGLVRRDESGQLWGCWLGEVSPRSSAMRVVWTKLQGNRPALPNWNESVVTASDDKRASAFLERWDQDADGKLTFAELSSAEALLEMARQVDARRGAARNLNRDGADDEVLDRNELVFCCRAMREGEISLGNLLDMVTGQLALRRGEIRLIGWADRSMPQLTIKPDASQSVEKTLVVVHLESGEMGDTERDANSWYDFNAPLSREEFDAE